MNLSESISFAECMKKLRQITPTGAIDPESDTNENS